MDVLVYVVDCLRSDHVSCYGHDRETTPTVDALAEDGIRYENCYAPATWTRPASVSVLTGTYPPTHGVRHREVGFWTGLDRLPELLSRAGMRTIGVSTMGNVSSGLGYDVGFDEFVDLYRDEAVVERRAGISTRRQRMFHEDRDAVALPRAEDVTECLLPRLEATDGGVFAFCWSIDPHMPLDPPEGHRTYLDPDYDGPVDGSFESIPDSIAAEDARRLRDLYDGEVRYTDEQLGELVAGLKSMDRYDDATIVVVGDHGEAFGEHGLRFHGNRPHEEVLRVPLVVKPPGGRDDPAVVSELASLVDVLPTVLEVVDAEERSADAEGRVLPPFGPPEPERAVFSDTQIRDVEPAHVSVRRGRWKYIRTETPPPPFVLRRLFESRETVPDLRYALATLRDSARAALAGPTEERLYDLETDPDERRNLIEERPEVAARLRGRVDEWRRGRSDGEPRGRVGAEDLVDAETREQLQQLGYAE